MPDSLALRVADRLDIQPEQTDRVLRTLAQLIKKQSARDGRVRVPGLGVFHQTLDALTFEPDHLLAEAVNERYSGLDPVRLSRPDPAAPPPPPSSVVEAETPPAEPDAREDTAAQDDEAPETRVEEPEAATATDADAVLPPSDDYEDPDVSEAAAYEALRKMPPAPADEPAFEEEPSEWAPPGTRWAGENLDELVEITDDADGQEEPGAMPPVLPATPVEEHESVTAPQPAAPEPERQEADRPTAAAQDRPASEPPKAPTRRRPRPSPPEAAGKRRPGSRWIWLALFFVVVTVGAYYVLTRGGQPAASDGTQATTEEPAAGQSPGPAGETGDAGDENAGGQTPEAGTGTQPPDAGQAQQQPAAPQPATQPAPETKTPDRSATVTGRLLDRTIGGFTLIVASNTDLNVAEAEAQRYRQRLSARALPVDVIRSTTNGVTRYRVAVGQVTSADEAVALKNQLGADVPADAWVTRILPDN